MVKFLKVLKFQEKKNILFLKWKKCVFFSFFFLGQEVGSMVNGNYPPFGFSFPISHIPSPILGGSKHVFLGQIL
jgi:hypothetical protein